MHNFAHFSCAVPTCCVGGQLPFDKQTKQHSAPVHPVCGKLVASVEVRSDIRARHCSVVPLDCLPVCRKLSCTGPATTVGGRLEAASGANCEVGLDTSLEHRVSLLPVDADLVDYLCGPLLKALCNWCKGTF